MTEKNRIRGKKARAAGQRFEVKVRHDLESKGWIVDKWSNNVDLKNKFLKENIIGKDILTGDKYSEKIYQPKLIPAKRKFNPFNKAMMLGAGFPDFIAFKHIKRFDGYNKTYTMIGCEVKSNGYLNKIEKEKCSWLLKNNVFSNILIASKGAKRGQIKYVEFEEKKP